MTNVPYDDFELGPSTIVYKVPPGSIVPKKGELIPTRTGDVLVTDSSSTQGYINVLIMKPKPLAERFSEYRVEVEAAMEHTAETIYKRTSTGLTAKVGWIALPDENKAEFYKLAYDIVMHFDIKNLLVLPYE